MKADITLALTLFVKLCQSQDSEDEVTTCDKCDGPLLDNGKATCDAIQVVYQQLNFAKS